MIFTWRRILLGGLAGALLAVLLETVAFGQEVTVTNPVPDQLRGGTVELVVFFLDRYAVYLAAAGATLAAGIKGWRPRMPTIQVRIEHAFADHLSVRWVRLARPVAPPPVLEEVEDVSERTPDEPQRQTHKPGRWVKP